MIKAGEFKTKCLELMDQVSETGEPIVITKRGKPVAQLAPIVVKPRKLRGFYKGKIVAAGDIISPIDVEWDVLKP